MSALRAIALQGFLTGTAIGGIGIIRDQKELAIAGAVIWTVGVAMGSIAHRLDPKFKAVEK